MTPTAGSLQLGLQRPRTIFGSHGFLSIYSTTPHTWSAWNWPVSNARMTEDTVISVENVSKAYRIWQTPAARLTSPLMAGIGRHIFGSTPPGRALVRRAEASYRDFWALKDISFEIRRGESVGIIGRNGSGKSTLLQIIAGTLQPTTGSVRVKGRVAALLELGSGFNLDFTGRENVFLNGAVLGLSRSEVEERFDAIAGFADIGEFIDHPAKTYSSGMLVRLAFSVQVQVEPEILIIDEALAVGDILFQKRCFGKMHELLDRGTTVVFVSHELESVRTLTKRAILLRDGCIRAIGSSAEVVLDYRRQTHDDERAYLNKVAAIAGTPAVRGRPTQPHATTSPANDYGDLDAVIEQVRVLDGTLQENATFKAGDTIVVEIRYRMRRALSGLNVGFRLRNREGVKIYSGGTFANDVNRWHRDPGAPAFWNEKFSVDEQFVLRAPFECLLGPNFYEIQAFICEEMEPRPDHQRMIHWRDEAAFFTVVMNRSEYWFGGVTDIRPTISCSRTKP